MAVTDRILGNIHLFPTKALYTANASSVANTDIAMLFAGASDGDAIFVEDKLEGNNGYIKYSNGLIIQWMLTYTSLNITDYIEFPIPFPTECFTVVASDCYKMRSIDNKKYYKWIGLVDRTKVIITSKQKFGSSHDVLSTGLIAIGR